MYCRKFALLWFFLIGVAGWVQPQIAEAQPNFPYRYAYISSHDNNNTLRLVNPADPLAPAEIVSLPTSESKRLYWVNVSPDGYWMLATMKAGDEDPPLLRLFTSNAELRHDFDLGQVNSAWSPDSRWLTLPVYNWAGALPWFTLSVYNLETDTLLNFVNEAEHFPYSYAWSADSTRLAVVSRVCDSLPCYTELQVYDASTWEVTVYSNPAPSILCGLVWSPDNQYIAFQYSCEVGVSQWVDDVFVWSLPTDEWFPVTHRTQPLTDKGFETTLSYLFDHSYFWLDKVTLITGSLGGRYWESGGFEDAGFTYDTRAYNVPEGTYAPVAQEVFAEWQVIPNHPHLFSYRRESYQLYDSEASLRLWQLTTAQLEISSLNGSTLSPIFTVEGGCKQKWSPDGRYLAHTIPNDGLLFCRGYDSSVEILDFDTLTNVTLSLDNSGDNSPIGWLYRP